MRGRLLLALGLAALAGCRQPPAETAAVSAASRPDLLLITLDTTRADAMGWEEGGVDTPALEALAARGRVFSRAFTTAPMTLPAHASMLTGLYPADHGIHENSRYLGADRELLAERLAARGYRTAAFVSGLPLSRQFGLARGFTHYDDELGTAAERDAAATTDRALAYLDAAPPGPLFLWVHYFDPHEPYEPPEPYRSRYPGEPYRAEIAFMDQHLGRLVRAFESRGERTGGAAILVAGDHGEGLGDHGERLHGNLLYQGVMRVPLVIAGDGVAAGRSDRPVSVRRIFDTLLELAGEERDHDLLAEDDETVLAEAMKPFLQYGWQPQVMAARGDLKVIRSGSVEIFDLAADPDESENLEGRVRPPRELLRPLIDYPLPGTGAAVNGPAPSQEDLERLAGLGYVTWRGETPRRDDAPDPKDMTDLFADLDRGSAVFVRGDYEQAREIFDRVLARDPENLMVCVRLAVANSLLGDGDRALELFERAREIAPGSADVRHYLALHLLRAGREDEAGALLETVLAEQPRRLPALEALARIRQAQDRPREAAKLLERVAVIDTDNPVPLLRLGEARMALADSKGAIRAFEKARGLQGDEEFAHDLELGVCYLADRQPLKARDALDRVPRSHPAYPMALFKRAQVSVLLSEPDREERVRLAYRLADDMTRPLIENEALFRDFALR